MPHPDPSSAVDEVHVSLSTEDDAPTVASTDDRSSLKRRRPDESPADAATAASRLFLDESETRRLRGRVRECHARVLRDRAARVAASLARDRDAVLRAPRRRRVVRRLPETTGPDSIVAEHRPARGPRRSARVPFAWCEGGHGPRPPHSAAVFLRSSYFAEDEQSLNHVPYFGDDVDADDVVAEVYDTERRERKIRNGPEYRREDADRRIEDAVRLLVGGESEGKDKDEDDDKQDEGEVRNRLVNKLKLNRMFKELASVTNETVERVYDRYRRIFGPNDNTQSPNSTKPDRESPNTKSTNTNENNHNDDDDQSSSHRKEPVKNSSLQEILEYETVMDSYRNLFCRRCFRYDCNIHGNLAKPDLTLQGELAVAMEKEGHWDKFPPMLTDHDDPSSSSSYNGALSNVTCCIPVPTTNGDTVLTINGATVDTNGVANHDAQPKSPLKLQPQQQSPQTQPPQLTPLQASICERAFLVFQGDIPQMARALGADPAAVASFASAQNYALQPPIHVKPSTDGGARRGRKGSGALSMRQYNPVWLRRVKGAEIHPAFVPCDHVGPCSEENCSCIRNATFCTKHCAWGRRGRNLFRGCACKAGQCRTKACPCFAAGRECDPDLCRRCGACEDPPHAPATRQRCRNDDVSMRRHAHLLMAESSVPNAGWGVYTKRSLRKDEYVHEYVGEVISQEEAERRGSVYDKVNRSYLFNLCSDFVVDASRKGNKTRFANHDSKPNCYTRMVNVNGDVRIALYAKEDIPAQSELFFDYRYDVGIENDLISKPGMTVDWMKNPKMANQISRKKNA